MTSLVLCRESENAAHNDICLDILADFCEKLNRVNCVCSTPGHKTEIYFLHNSLYFGSFLLLLSEWPGFHSLDDPWANWHSNKKPHKISLFKHREGGRRTILDRRASGKKSSFFSPPPSARFLFSRVCPQLPWKLKIAPGKCEKCEGGRERARSECEIKMRRKKGEGTGPVLPTNFRNVPIIMLSCSVPLISGRRWGESRNVPKLFSRCLSPTKPCKDGEITRFSDSRKQEFQGWQINFIYL